MCVSTVQTRLLLFTGSNCIFYPLKIKSKSKSVACSDFVCVKPSAKLISAARPTVTKLANLVASCKSLYFVIFANKALMEYVHLKLRCRHISSFQDKSFQPRLGDDHESVWWCTTPDTLSYHPTGECRRARHSQQDWKLQPRHRPRTHPAGLPLDPLGQLTSDILPTLHQTHNLRLYEAGELPALTTASQLRGTSH